MTLRELSARATQGQWAWNPDAGNFIQDDRNNVIAEVPCRGANEADGEFIVACVNFVRNWLATRERL